MIAGAGEMRFIRTGGHRHAATSPSLPAHFPLPTSPFPLLTSPVLSWNEIRHRAIAFSREWRDTTSEQAEKQSYWNDFFHIFGIKRKAVATFEEPVKKLSGNWGFIDLFWPGRVLIEHKSAGQDLGKAHTQAMDYIRGLVDTGRHSEAPRFLIVSDFKRIALHDLEPENDPDLPLFKRLPPSIEFPIEDLHKHIRRFAFIPGYKQHKLDPEDPANLEAAALMAKLHDALENGGFSGHDLRVLLVRLLFCLFADDTGIFLQKSFHLYLDNRTAGDGSDTGPKLARLFETLNTPEDKRQANLDEDLREFPYINGDLFAERISFADFDAQMRGQLLQACDFEWAKISPAIFGSLFQGVMDGKERRQIGAHYTSERDILKLIRPLFLDALRAEFKSAVKDKSGRGPGRLKTLQKKLAALRFLDPACGCGNFLVITYRELRALEFDILLALHTFAGLLGHQELGEQEVYNLSIVDVDQMFGIELEEFPARIAEVALWLTDHQANVSLSEAFGQMYRRIPLKKSPHIVNANALTTPWENVISPADCSYILGNPPFVGSKYSSPEQKADLEHVWGKVKGSSLLDFVTCWHRIAAQYIHSTTITAAFVSTNSICQGEQPSILWPTLFQRYDIKIHFAHRTFTWISEARGKAHVHCVIVGFGAFDREDKLIFETSGDDEQIVTTPATNINPYLVDGPDLAIPNRSKPLCDVPEIAIGNKPIDGGNYLFTRQEKQDFLTLEPAAKEWFRKWIGSDEFINGWNRWCLWLGDCPPAVLRQMPMAMQRVENVRKFRLASKSEPTRKLAAFPTRFHVENFPTKKFLVIPKVSSERRPYIPIGYLTPSTLCSDLVFIVSNATPYHFGILSSTMHMAWMRQVAGRLKSDYRYSAGLVYNNYPWPEGASDAQRAKIEECAAAVLAAREQFPGSTLADLYDPVTMPPLLAKAHEALDRAVERAYRKEPFPSDRQRVEFLFSLYEKLTAPLAVVKKPRKGR